jgi:hypothetical protein
MLVRKHGKNWSSYEKIVTKRALKIISEGAITHTKYNLPPIRANTANPASSLEKK